MSRVALDTNIIAYIAGVDRHADDQGKIERSRDLLRRLRGRATLILPVQTLGELFVVLTRSGATREDAREMILRMAQSLAVVDTGRSTLFAALDLVAAHKLQFWDALILNAAADAGCALLLSEDMAAGFSWRGTTVVDPLSSPVDERLAALLG